MEAVVIPEADLVVAIRPAADAPPSAVAGPPEQADICRIGTPTQATPTPGMGTVAPGMGTVAPGMGTVAPGMGTVAPGMGTVAPGMGTVAPGTGTPAPGMGTVVPGMDMVTGADMGATRSTIIGFLSGSFRIGIQDGGITITDTLITRITRTTIPIITTRTTATTLAETNQRASKY
jgi:hypothetical protein